MRTAGVVLNIKQVAVALMSPLDYSSFTDDA